MKKHQSSKAFTLLEILLVVGIISLLAGIVIVAINPGKQLATVRNTQRKSDIKQLNSAITQYYIKEGRYPSTVLGTLTEICDTGTATTSSTCGTLVDLSILVPTYITAIPKDPQGPNLALNKIINTVYAAPGGTGYYVMKDTTNKLVVASERAELNAIIAIGTSTDLFGGVTPPLVAGCTATGGTETTVGGYKIHTFTAVGTSTFNVTAGTCDVDVLVVAGGGSGGLNYYGAGGGAGGLISTTTSVTGIITVSVGNGAPRKTTNGIGTDGGNSVFGIYTAIGGGGGGGGVSGASGRSGGSGGGGGSRQYGGSGTAGSGTTGQGSSGGAGMGLAGGGGGSGGVGGGGGTFSAGNGGAGGAGLLSDISGTSLYYAAGGGGCAEAGRGGVGGSGIGGNGASGVGYTDVPTDGTDGTGSGGGGGYEQSIVNPARNFGGAGGSGIVIVRYAI